MKKSKLTVQHPTIDYLTTMSTTRENDVATEQYLLLNRQNSRRSIPLIKNSIQDVFCTPKGSTRVSNASSFAKHSEHLHLLPTRTTKKRINISKSSFDNQRVVGAKRHDLRGPRDKFSTFFRSCYSISYFNYQLFFVKLK